MYAFVGAFVDELARGWLRHVCICPGSRSTPLALSFARHPAIRVWTHVDERSAAFFALGLAKAAREPVAVVCTSGTAAANFMPAVVEARHARVPLLVLTADRPHELRDCGAPQTIDQIRFYGAQVKWAVELPLPEASEMMLRYARTTADRALATAQAAPAGPVHLNFPFREPLMPESGALPPPAVSLHRRPHDAPYAHTIVPHFEHDISAPVMTERLEWLLRMPRGLIVCGDGTSSEASGSKISELARALGYPILADPLSGLRCGGHERSLVIDAYDAFLRDERFAAALRPDVVLRFGAMPTSKPLLQYLQRYPEAEHILVDESGWRDPTLLVSMVAQIPPAHFIDLCGQAVDRPVDLRWLDLWQAANRAARQALARELAAIDEPFEGNVMAELADLLPDGSTLVAGNSMPVRDIDTFFHGSERRIRILGNRGASGIDGVVSTALGVAAAGDGPTVLAIGDLSLYHDSNGLLAARHYGLDLTIVLLNNDGGGIFSFLPQASLLTHDADPVPAPRPHSAGSYHLSVVEDPVHGDGNSDLFEALFGTPHGLQFAHLAALYGARYTRVTDWPAFRDAVRAGLAEGGLHIVEVPTDRARNVVLHRRCWPAVAAALADLSYPPEEEMR